MRGSEGKGAGGADTSRVVKKLVFFSLLMWLIPASLYWMTSFVDVKENPQLYGYVAVVLVNLVVVLYIVQAFREKPAASGKRE